jgi:hypothetical protein
VGAFKELSTTILNEQAFGSPEQEGQAEALVQALFGLYRVSLPVAAHCLWEVFKGARNDSLQNVAGRHLPILSVPRFDKLFDKVIATQPSSWAKKLVSHWRTASYLRKRDERSNCRPAAEKPNVRHPRPECFWPVDALELAERLVSPFGPGR